MLLDHMDPAVVFAEQFGMSGEDAMQMGYGAHARLREQITQLLLPHLLQGVSITAASGNSHRIEVVKNCLREVLKARLADWLRVAVLELYLSDQRGYDPLLRLVRQWLGPSENPRDFVQTAVTKAIAYLQREGNLRGDARAWLRTIVRRVYVDHVVTARREDRLGERVKNETEVPDKHDDLQEVEEKLEIEMLLAKLSASNRWLIEQVFLERRPRREIADELQISLDAIEKRILRALLILRRENGHQE